MANSNNINPPPIQIPPEWALEKGKNKFFTGLINTLYQLWNSVYSLRVPFKVTTSDATPTAVMRIPVANGRTTMVIATVVARKAVTGESSWYHLMGAYKNISGVLTGIGTPLLWGGEDIVGWDLYFSSLSDEILVTVLGAASSDITWEGQVSSYVVGA